MAAQIVEKELADLERKYWQAMKDKDVAMAQQLTDDECLLTGAQGVSRIERKQLADMLSSPTWTLNDFALSDVQVRVVNDDVAIVAYKVREEMTVEGKPLSLEAADASTWVRKNGQWLCALHTESITGDPFGRDRAKA